MNPQPLIQATLYAGAFFGIYSVAQRALPTPSTILEVEDQRKKEKEKVEYFNAYPSILFGVAISLWSLHSILDHGTSFVQPNIPAFQRPMVMAYGFFIHEFVLGVSHGHLDFNFLFHHVASLAYAAIICHSGVNGAESVKAMMLCEITGPLRGLNIILKAYKKWSARKVVGTVSIVLFLSLRIVPLYKILVGFQLESVQMSFSVVFPTMIWFVSMSWVWDMVNKLSKLVAQALPGVELAQIPYKAMKRVRKLKALYLVLIGYISVHNLIFKIIEKMATESVEAVLDQIKG